MPGPLSDVRVLDFTHAMAGPFGSMVLADLGAEVILVSRPEERDDRKRGLGPYLFGRSTYRFSLERGKKNIQIDLKHPDGLELVLRLAEKADVLTENFLPGTMERLGLSYENVSKRNPRIVYASISGHGQTGPYAKRGAFDIVAQAMSGLMSITGEAEGRPMRVGASLGDSVGGAYLAMGVISALYEREKSGLGQRIDVSMVESLLYHMENPIIRHSVTGETPGRIGPRHPLTAPFQPFETSDGWIVLCGVRDWDAFCVVIGREELAADERFRTASTRNTHHAVLEPVLADAMKRRTTEEWTGALEGICITCPLYTVQEAINDPQIRNRGAIVELPFNDPSGQSQTVLTPNVPMRLSRTSPRIERAPSWVGEDTRAVLEELLSMTSDDVAAFEASGVVRTGGPGVP